MSKSANSEGSSERDLRVKEGNCTGVRSIERNKPAVNATDTSTRMGSKWRDSINKAGVFVTVLTPIVAVLLKL